MELNREQEQELLYFRQHAAMHLKVPDSGLVWLDAMIIESRRLDAMQAAMAGMLAGALHDHATHDDIAAEAGELADALVAEMRKGGE